MDRREALKALVSLPATARISVAQLKPDDVIVIESDEILSQNEMAEIREQVQRVWPGRKAIVLSKPLRLKVAEG